MNVSCLARRRCCASVRCWCSYLIVGRSRQSGRTRRRRPLRTVEQQLTEPTAEQVAALEKLMNGATLVGHFTVTGAEVKGDLPKERYELGEVKRLESGDWLIRSGSATASTTSRCP